MNTLKSRMHDPDVIPGELPEFDEKKYLTKKQKIVIKYLVHGYGTKETAHLLGVMPRTIETHVHNVYQRFRVRNLIEITRIVYGLPTRRLDQYRMKYVDLPSYEVPAVNV